MDNQTQFEKFHENNPAIYEMFWRFAHEVIDRGYKKYSADAIMHRVRWETNIVTDSNQFKINNNHVAFYARLFMKDNPAHAAFFETRTQNVA